MTSLVRSGVPNAMDLMDVDLDTNIYGPYKRKGVGGSSDVADVRAHAARVKFMG